MHRFIDGLRVGYTLLGGLLMLADAYDEVREYKSKHKNNKQDDDVYV